ncbi:hypothetical protein N7462_002456 [Penicillium macrosclerotiorum]|uniref:uncharacterized protein n=1 Tax=Penicillium macrosclerotiorum TaxID=303699 RepID=UPI00254963D4|nr:uncharacterized protein N7462_002456 [Penicillium macrosclerotiorum]KAJ5693033.1 hypothetical protein N7462_002456 [Penicillium macrosclerotiorum]
MDPALSICSSLQKRGSGPVQVVQSDARPLTISFRRPNLHFVREATGLKKKKTPRTIGTRQLNGSGVLRWGRDGPGRADINNCTLASVSRNDPDDVDLVISRWSPELSKALVAAFETATCPMWFLMTAQLGRSIPK